VAQEVPAGGSAPTPDTRGDAGGTSSSNPPPTPEEMEVVFGRRLWSGAKQEAAPVPLPRMLSHAHQVLSDTRAAILREWEVLEAEHQRLSDWRTQLEERTKTASDSSSLSGPNSSGTTRSTRGTSRRCAPGS
jgi:hypothetical protein